MATYNGHKNWNHWNVSLWIGNDEELYSLACAMVRTYTSLDMAARAIVATLVKQGFTHTPDGAPYTFATVRAAIRGMKE